MKNFCLLIVTIGCVFVLSSCAPLKPRFPTHVLLSANSQGLAAQIRECMKQATAQGLSIKVAIKQCGYIELKLPASSGISIGDVLISAGRGHSVGEAACKGTSANPMLATDPTDGDSPIFQKPSSLIDAQQGFDNAKDKFADWALLDMELNDSCGSGKTSACVALLYQETALNLILAEINYYGQEIKKYTGSDPSKVGGGKGRPTAEAESSCQRVSEFIGSCNRVGWSSNECKLFNSKLKKCADPTIALTDGDPPTNCELPAADEKQKKKIALFICSLKTRPAGPDSNPCEKVNIEGDVDIFRYGKGIAPGCNDPQALTTGEDCIQTLEVSSFGRKEIKDIIKEIKEFGDRVGGPVVIFPTGPKPWPPVK